MPDWVVQEGQMKYSLQTTGTRAFLLEMSTLREMEKGLTTPDLNNRLLYCVPVRCQGWTPFLTKAVSKITPTLLQAFLAVINTQIAKLF